MRNKQTEYTVQALENLFLDKTVDPPVMRRGIVGKASNGSWYDIAVNTDGSIISNEKESIDFEGSQVTVGTTEVEVTFTGTTQSIYIEADCENAGFIFIGKTGVTTITAMAKLEPGASITIELNDTDNGVFVISDTASQIIRKMALL